MRKQFDAATVLVTVTACTVVAVWARVLLG